MLTPLLLIGCVTQGGVGSPPVRDPFADTWAATDGMGRAISMGRPGGGIRRNRTVAMFYFLSNHLKGGRINDNTKLLAANPSNPRFGPFGAPHWWGEPWFGYYQSEDRAVIRKHMQMLADAGVDVIVFDNTNGPTYPDVYIPICQVIEEMRAQGNPAPQIAFFAGNDAWSTLYRDFYSRNLFPDLWFRWKGKPLMMFHLTGGRRFPPKLASYFTARESWAWTPGDWFRDGHDKWPWLQNYPQDFGWHEDPKRPEEVSVCVAQHATTNIGRSSIGQQEPAVDDTRLTPYTAAGRCFAQQFERAIAIDPEMIFVTGWNEWTAARYKMRFTALMAGKMAQRDDSLFVDEYNAEFSRDIEPAKGITSDNYYYQLVDYVRRYKGGRSTLAVSRERIVPRTGFAQWKDVVPEYRDDVGDPVKRDHPGWGTLRYVNQTGRNDIVAAKVAYDADNVYFYVRTHDALSRPQDPNWMLLYLDVDHNSRTGWLGYDFVVNRSVAIAHTSLERNVGNVYRWARAADLDFLARGNELVVTVPRAALGIRGASATIDFKWADNIAQTGDASDFTLNGDAAPNDRFNYRAIIGR